MENCLEAKSLIQGNADMWPTETTRVRTLNPRQQCLALGLLRDCISTLESKGKWQKEGGAANHHSPAVAELRHHCLLPCFSPGCAYRCENRRASSSIRRCACETMLLTNICEVGVLGCRKWTNDGFFFIVLHIINLFLGKKVNQHTQRWSV